jgi:hypothetical protein
MLSSYRTVDLNRMKDRGQTRWVTYKGHKGGEEIRGIYFKKGVPVIAPRELADQIAASRPNQFYVED